MSGREGSSHFDRGRLYGLVVEKKSDDLVTMLCGSTYVTDTKTVRLPRRRDEVSPGCWVNIEANPSTGNLQVVEECEPVYGTYLFDEGTLSVVCPEGTEEDTHSIAFTPTPFSRFVEVPKGQILRAAWMEFYEVRLTRSSNWFFPLKVDRIVGYLPGCIERGSLAGKTPNRQIMMDTIKQYKGEQRNNYDGVERDFQWLLGLCIGHVRSSTDATDDEKDNVIFAGRGVMLLSKKLSSFDEGDWLTLCKAKKFPTNIIKCDALPEGHGGECRRGEKGKWDVQVRVRTHYGRLRSAHWFDTFFNIIHCSKNIRSNVRRRLSEVTPGWKEMTKEEQYEVVVIVWVCIDKEKMKIREEHNIESLSEDIEWKVCGFAQVHS